MEMRHECIGVCTCEAVHILKLKRDLTRRSFVEGDDQWSNGQTCMECGYIAASNVLGFRNHNNLSLGPILVFISLLLQSSVDRKINTERERERKELELFLKNESPIRGSTYLLSLSLKPLPNERKARSCHEANLAPLHSLE